MFVCPARQWYLSVHVWEDSGDGAALTDAQTDAAVADGERTRGDVCFTFTLFYSAYEWHEVLMSYIHELIFIERLFYIFQFFFVNLI